MNTATRNKLMILCSILAAIITALFWTFWYIFVDSVPSFSQIILITDGNGNPIVWTLPFNIYR